MNDSDFEPKGLCGYSRTEHFGRQNHALQMENQALIRALLAIKIEAEQRGHSIFFPSKITEILNNLSKEVNNPLFGNNK